MYVNLDSDTYIREGSNTEVKKRACVIGFARPIMIYKSACDFINDYTFFIGNKRKNLRCLIDTGAGSSMINEKVVRDFKENIYDVMSTV